MKKKTPLIQAQDIIKQHGGIVRTTTALQNGIHPRILYQLRDRGILEELSFGLYRLAHLPPLSNPDFVITAMRIPRAVICLVSALSFYELTTQVPHHLAIALPKGTKEPVLKYPPIQVHHFSSPAYEEGIEEYDIDSVSVRIYSIEKTLADCFKFRNKIGMDIVLESLKLYQRNRQCKFNELMKYAKICRIEKLIFPYVEMIV